jgi:hypothetical protein
MIFGNTNSGSYLHGHNNDLSITSAAASAAAVAALSAGPPEPVVNYVGAVHYLFSQAKQDPAAIELCHEIELDLEPPVVAGVLLYLFRLQAIGRLQDWPLLFGEENSFILYLIQKMEKDYEFPTASVNERTIWNDRRRETAEWVKERTLARAQTMVAQPAVFH